MIDRLNPQTGITDFEDLANIADLPVVTFEEAVPVPESDGGARE